VSFVELCLDIEHVTDYLSTIVDLNDLKIYGEHNLRNLYFAHKMWRAYFNSDDAFVEACKSFDGVHYRFQLISDKHGLKIFNDAKSTNWDATVTALRAVEKNIILVLGGQLRGEGDNGLEKILPFKDKIKKVYLIGEAGDYLLPIFKDELPVEYVKDLPSLKASVDESKEQGNLIFSPAFPSFDQFKNYIERGQKFTELFGA
jgi:UDP-N-acetylmuramoylalanine--D-glutamate ligase